MKLKLTGLITLILIFSACEKIDEQVVGPTEIQNENFGKISSTDIVPINFALIPLPEKSPIYLDSIFSVTKLINGLLGGIITLDMTYISKYGTLVTSTTTMLISPLSFIGNKRITLTIEDNVAVMKCEPGMNFLHPVSVTQTFTGLDLKNINADDIDYGYINNNGNYYPVPNDGIIVLKPLGLVTVINAQINHFSRYGWVRKDGNSN